MDSVHDRLSTTAAMSPFLRKILGLNWILVLTMYALLIIGLYAIESAARHLPVSDELMKTFGSAGAYYADRQKQWILVGSVIYFATALFDYRWIRWLALPVYVVSLVCMAKVMGSDSEVHQIDIGPINFQPAQLGVISGVLMIAWLLEDMPKIHVWLGAAWIRIGLIAVLAGVPFLMIMKMGDMGSALVWIPVAIVALLIGGVPFRYMSFMGIIGFGLVPVIYLVVLPMVSKRGPERIKLYLDMMNEKQVDISGSAYGAYYVSMAVGKSGWTGAGWNAAEENGSLHAKRYVPWKTAHTDFIFAVYAEEQGFRGSLVLISAFALLLIQCLFISFYSRDAMGRMVVCCVAMFFFAHIFENIGMCALIMPITGIPLPLISYSGTFVVMCMFMLGLVQSVWTHRNSLRIIEVKATL
jgi:rod shape determining protein RodA